MSSDYENFWVALPEKALHPVRVPIIEALRWIAEPLSALETVDALDGFLSMWEAAHHLQVLEALGVVERVPADVGSRRRNDSFGIQFRLAAQGDGFGNEDDVRAD